MRESPPVDDEPPPEREINTMTQDDLDRLRESCSFPVGIHTKLPEDDETFVSIRPSKVASYKTSLHAGLCLPLHPIIKRILHFYNISPA